MYTMASRKGGPGGESRAEDERSEAVFEGECEIGGALREAGYHGDGGCGRKSGMGSDYASEGAGAARTRGCERRGG